VRLVDDHQPRPGGELGQDEVAEVGVVEPLRAHQQHVDGARLDLGEDLVPVAGVGRVDRAGADARPLGRLDLVAHQRQQRRDDHGRAGAALAEQPGRHEVHGGLAPARPLDDQGPAPLDDEGGDRRPLVVAEPRVLAGEGPQASLGLVPQSV
jgi:hypothetical protein